MSCLCSSADDLAVLKWGYKRSREFARRLKSYRGEYTPSHPVFPKNSAAVTSGDNQPSPIEAANIEYTEEDEEAIVEFTRKAGKGHQFVREFCGHLTDLLGGTLICEMLQLEVATAWHSVRIDPL